MIGSRIGLTLAGVLVLVGLYAAVFGGWRVAWEQVGGYTATVVPQEVTVTLPPLPVAPHGTASANASLPDPALALGIPLAAPAASAGWAPDTAPELSAPALPLPGGGAGGTAGTRLVFLLDQSGSMWEDFGSTSRLSLARAELVRLIRRLDPSVTFNVIVYGQEWRTFRREPVRATEDLKMLAVQFLGQRHATGGSTNMASALGRALAMGPHRLVLLTDGEFNVETETLLTEASALRARLHPAATLSVLAFSPRINTDAKPMLQRLCHDNGGEYVDWQPSTGLPLAASSVADDLLAN